MHNNERPTREFETTGGHKLVLNEYITGAENWQIRQIYARGLRKESDDSSTSLEAEKKGFELAIVSFDGDTKGVADKVLALPLHEYREVFEQVLPIVEGKKKSETSSPSTPATGSSEMTS